jgi:hypothetical protein
MRVLLPLAAVLLAAACLAPPGQQSTGDPVPEPSPRPPKETIGVPPGFTPRASPSPSVMPTPFPEYTAVDCAGRPAKDQIIALVRRETDISPGDAIAAPVCAGTWQYTVLAVPGRDAIAVLTKTTPTGLALVAVGTDVCSLDLKHQAPTGIYLAASC